MTNMSAGSSRDDTEKKKNQWIFLANFFTYILVFHLKTGNWNTVYLIFMGVAESWFWCLLSHLSPHGWNFNARLVFVIFVVGKLTLDRFISEYFCYCLSVSFCQCSILIYLSLTLIHLSLMLHNWNSWRHRSVTYFNFNFNFM
jgi:hypothetical protein